MSSKQVVQQSSSSSMMQSSSSSSSSKSVSVKSSSSTQSSTQRLSSSKMVSSSGAVGSGLDVDAEIQRMKIKMDEQMSRMKQEMRMLLPASAGGGQLIRLDEKQIQSCVDDSNKIKFDVDVTEFANETVVVKSDGNKIEVQAKKFVKKGDQEHQEEYSRTYELPSGMDTKMVTSSMQKDGGLLTIELPV